MSRTSFAAASSYPTTQRKWEALRQRAQSGDPEAQWAVGTFLEDGLKDRPGRTIVRANARAAVFWYRRSARAGCAAAQINLGNLLSAGRGCRRNDAEALWWYKRALRQGDDCAPNNIAAVYNDWGRHRRAAYWHKRAALSGDGDAWVEVGKRYYSGTGVRRNATEAVRCFRRAIVHRNVTQTGREEAMFRLALACYEGRGARKSFTKALYWLAKANGNGDNPQARELIETIRAERSRT